MSSLDTLRHRRPLVNASNGPENTGNKAQRTDEQEEAVATEKTPLIGGPEDNGPGQHRSEIARLWLQSRCICDTGCQHEITSLTPQKNLRRKGDDRPVNLTNIRLAFRLFLLTWSSLLGIFWQEKRLAVVAWIAGKLIKGSLPACRLWAQSRMLDLVQNALTSGKVDRDEVVRTAVTTILLQSGDDVYTFLSRQNDYLVRNLIELRLSKAYLSATMSLSIPALSNPYLSALMYEAGVFCGQEPHNRRSGGWRMSDAFEFLGSIVKVFSELVEVATQTLLIIRTITCAGQGFFTYSTLVLFALAIAPGIVKLISKWVLSRRINGKHSNHYWHRLHQTEHDYRAMSQSHHKQEVVLFGLKDWVLDHWAEAREASRVAENEASEKRQVWELGTNVVEHGIGDLFHVLLALQALSTTLSLGSIRLYQSATRSLLFGVRRLLGSLEVAFQSIFYFAAFCEATRDPQAVERRFRRRDKPFDTPMLDYETVRDHQGMGIETRNLGFTYPNAKRPVLKGINLSIAPGEALAIVGLNGGGKTTLIKALMGLYDHSGVLLINGHPVEDYDPTTLHRRTSCLFQDFGRHNFTLRQNIGLGSLKHMDDVEEIELALERGGAQGVKDKVGLEGKLSRFTSSNEVDEEDEEKEKPKDSKANGTTEGTTCDGKVNGTVGLLKAATKLLSGATGLKAKKEEKKKDDDDDDKTKGLSGGQWQKVALARAFLRSDDADLVVFDEPSASLDPRAESELFQRIHALSTQGGRKITTIYISHRFSTVRRADRIAVVEDGAIIELGTHEELMALHGRYLELFNISKEGFEDILPASSVLKRVKANGSDSISLPPTPVTPHSGTFTPL